MACSKLRSISMLCISSAFRTPSAVIVTNNDDDASLHDEQQIHSRKAHPVHKEFAMPAHGEGLDASLEHFRSYHNSNAIVKKLDALTKDCAVPLTTEWVKDKQSDGELFVARLGKQDAEKKVLVSANEHAREMMTGEVALRFVELACKNAGPSSSSLLQQQSQKLFDSSDGLQYVIAPLVNKKGRELVETNTAPCQRMTVDSEGGVDLNRNMDVDWGKGDKVPWGKKPFSQYQSRILKDLAQENKPVVFVDLHTGTKSLMTSWGYKHFVTSDYKDQEKMLNVIKKEHCPDCPIGPNSEIVGYENPGEVLDHMYAKEGIKYSTLWEIFGGKGGHNDCIPQFNPKDDEYEEQVGNWARSLLTLGDYVHANVDKDEQVHPDLVKWDSKGWQYGDSLSLLELSDQPVDMLTTS